MRVGMTVLLIVLRAGSEREGGGPASFGTPSLPFMPEAEACPASPQQWMGSATVAAEQSRWPAPSTSAA